MGGVGKGLWVEGVGWGEKADLQAQKKKKKKKKREKENLLGCYGWKLTMLEFLKNIKKKEKKKG